MKVFQIAPMCTMIRIITLVLLALPVLFILSAVFGRALLIAPTILLVAIYAWVWLRFRPTQFVVHQDVLEVIWPLKQRRISRDSISDVRIVNSRDLKQQVGWGIRVGAGGLWGGLGGSGLNGEGVCSDVYFSDQ